MSLLEKIKVTEFASMRPMSVNVTTPLRDCDRQGAEAFGWDKRNLPSPPICATTPPSDSGGGARDPQSVWSL
jgi:hypothetical protein